MSPRDALPPAMIGVIHVFQFLSCMLCIEHRQVFFSSRTVAWCVDGSAHTANTECIKRMGDQTSRQGHACHFVSGELAACSCQSAV